MFLTNPASDSQCFSLPGHTQVGRAEAEKFQPSPLEPSWILAGNPIARSSPMTRSADGSFTSGRWECTAGKFKFYYACDEVIQILEGNATIEDAGRTWTLGPGDVAFFPQGMTAIWTVDTYVKKFAIFRVKPRRLLGRIKSAATRLWNAATGRHGDV